MKARETSRNANIWAVAFVRVTLNHMSGPPLGAFRTVLSISIACSNHVVAAPPFSFTCETYCS
jgi:hypothetical protein